MNTTAQSFTDSLTAEALASLNGDPANRADDINAWLYGGRRRSIPETHYSVSPDDNEIFKHNAQRHASCISRTSHQVPVGEGNMTTNEDFPSHLQQLTHGLSAQTEVLAESNLIQNRFYQCQEVREDSKRDRTKKIHPSIIRMIGRATAP